MGLPSQHEMVTLWLHQHISSRTQPSTAIESWRRKYLRPHDLFIQVIQIKRASIEHVLPHLAFWRPQGKSGSLLTSELVQEGAFNFFWKTKLLWRSLYITRFRLANLYVLHEAVALPTARQRLSSCSDGREGDLHQLVHACNIGQTEERRDRGLLLNQSQTESLKNENILMSLLTKSEGIEASCSNFLVKIIKTVISSLYSDKIKVLYNNVHIMWFLYDGWLVFLCNKICTIYQQFLHLRHI